jgi:hypothetical protein
MQTTTKVGAVTFAHDDQFKGEVEITKGGLTLVVPIEALRRLVAESVRYELADHVSKMKPEALLRRIA